MNVVISLIPFHYYQECKNVQCPLGFFGITYDNEKCDNTHSFSCRTILSTPSFMYETSNGEKVIENKTGVVLTSFGRENFIYHHLLGGWYSEHSLQLSYNVQYFYRLPYSDYNLLVSINSSMINQEDQFVQLRKGINILSTSYRNQELIFDNLAKHNYHFHLNIKYPHSVYLFYY